MVGSLEISESNRLYDIKYAPYADEYLGKAHGDGYQHMKRWLKKRFIFCDTLFDYAPSYNNDVLTIRANTLNEMNLTIETYTPLYQHVSFYNGNMEKIKITPGQPMTFKGFAQTETDQEVLIYGGSNIKKITGIQSMNPNSMLIGGATRLTELDISNCPILTIVNSNKANFSPHTYLNKLNMSNCPQLGGNLNVSNSPLLQEIKARNSAVTGLLLPTSLRNLKTLELPNTITSLSLYDAASLDTLKFDEGVEMQSIELSNCPGITNTENFDLTQTPTVILDNSYDTEELYMSEATNLTLRNMSNLERVIYTPNSEYSEFDINNVINGKNYKVTTNSCPKLTTFMTTAPHRISYNNSEVIYAEVPPSPIPTYMLDAPVTFNGTSDYIDTGIQLFDTAKDFSLYIDFSSNVTGQARNSTVFHCIYESSPYRGLTIAVSDNGYFLGGQASSVAYISSMEQGKYLINFKKGVLHSVKRVINDVITDVTLTNTDSTYAQINQTILLGCYQDANGNKGRYWNGTINDFGVWIDKTITDEELFGFINKVFEENIIRKDYGDITPNTAFTANTLDLSSTQFTDIKLLCTTDVYNLKVPTTMKNFYCDSAMDIDTDVIEDASYEVIHEELIEPYTTHYEEQVLLNGEMPNIIPSSANGSLIFNMYSNNTTQPTSTSPYMWDLTGLKLEDFYTYGMNNWVKQDENNNITMPQRMPGYSVRLVNADITPNEYPTMLYPKWIDVGLPITGKLDYTAYNGTSLAWAYAYTTDDVSINPLDSRSQEQITNDYNKLYGTDFIDIVDVWVYKDTDVSKLSTNENITKAYIELTSDNYKTRVSEALTYYPNCTDICLFDDGSVNSLFYMANGGSKIKNVEFLDGYFDNLTNMENTFQNCTSLTTVTAIPSSVTKMARCFQGCSKLTTAPTIPNGVTDMYETFKNCTSLTTVSTIPSSVTDMGGTFYMCSSLTTAPTIPNGITSLKNTFYGCTKLTTVPNIPSSVTDMSYTFQNCSALTQAPNIPNGVTNMNSTFYYCSSLTTVSTIPSSVTDMGYTFYRCSSLTQAPKILSTSITDIGSLYRSCTNLQSCEVPIYVDACTNALYDVPSTCDITWLGERKTNLNVTNTLNYKNANATDIQELVPEHLADLTELGTTATLTLGETYLAYLTEEEIEQATNKGWTLQ